MGAELNDVPSAGEGSCLTRQFETTQQMNGLVIDLQPVRCVAVVVVG